MSDQGVVIRELERAGERGETVVLASIVHTEGSVYRGVGTRMIVRADASAAGLISGGCLEADLVVRSHDVIARGVAEIVTYDTRSDDDLVWGLGLGCDGLVQVLLEPLASGDARSLADLLERAQKRRDPSVLATTIGGLVPLGARLLMDEAGHELGRVGNWPAESAATAILTNAEAAILAERQGITCEADDTDVALEVIQPPLDLVICGSGPDVAPVARLGSEQGWNVIVVDHRPVMHEHVDRFPTATVAECSDPERLDDAVTLTDGSAVVVMSHNYPRDLEYVSAALRSPAPYVGVLGPRRRTNRMLSDLSARGESPDAETLTRLYAPVGLDIGGDGPEAIALSIIAEVLAVTSGRGGGSLRERRAPIHDSSSEPAPVLTSV